jgi:hypothetical protein
MKIVTPSDLTEAALIITLIGEERVAQNFRRNRNICNNLFL